MDDDRSLEPRVMSPADAQAYCAELAARAAAVFQGELEPAAAAGLLIVLIDRIERGRLPGDAEALTAWCILSRAICCDFIIAAEQSARPTVGRC